MDLALTCGALAWRKSLAVPAIAALMFTDSLAHAGPDGSGISDGVVRIAVLGDYGSGATSAVRAR